MADRTVLKTPWRLTAHKEPYPTKRNHDIAMRGPWRKNGYFYRQSLLNSTRLMRDRVYWMLMCISKNHTVAPSRELIVRSSSRRLSRLLRSTLQRGRRDLALYTSESPGTRVTDHFWDSQLMKVSETVTQIKSWNILHPDIYFNYYFLDYN